MNDIFSLISIGIGFGVGLGVIPFLIGTVIRSIFKLFMGDTDIV